MLSRRIILIGLIGVIMCGCASNAVYRDQYAVCTVSPQQQCQNYALQIHNSAADDEHLLGFIEINDQGQLKNRAQFKTVIDTLYGLASKESLLVHVFVHGWHHSAQPGDENIESFRQSLAEMSAVESNLSHRENREKRKIVGLYIGWRGESITIPGVNNLTFWDRKNAAQEVGHLGLTEILLRLEEISNIKNSLDPPIKSRLVVIGHSFGGAAVFSAISQILADRFVGSEEGKNYVGEAGGYADLVILLNPAFEALKYAPLFELAQFRCSYFETQRPKLVILTSEADSATKYAFPAGRFFSTLLEKYQSSERSYCNRKNWSLTISERESDRIAVGHYRTFHQSSA